jgi:hypothetical protein
VISHDFRTSFGSTRVGEMNFFNRERKIFGDWLEPDAPKLNAPLETTKEHAHQEDESHDAENAKQGTLIFTNRASLFFSRGVEFLFQPHLSHDSP